VRPLAGLAVLYLLLPGHPIGLLTGVPLKPLSLTCLVVLACLALAFWPGLPLRGSRVLRAAALVMGGLIVLKVGLALLAPAYGLPGRYFANSRYQNDAERSTDFPSESVTRRDRELSFGGDEFPVYFLNDRERFNFYGEDADKRKNLPFSIRWQGVLQVPADGTYRLWLTASGPAELSVDGEEVASVDADGRDTREVELRLSRGSHEFRVSYARRPPRSGYLKVDTDIDGARRAVAVPYLLAGPVTPEVWERDRLLGTGARGVDIGFVLLLGLGLVSLVTVRARQLLRATGGRWALVERPLLGLFLLAVYAHAAVPELDRVDKMSLLGGGQDWLTHETFARDILLNGPLMTLGKPLGEGDTFYAQPFYPYALAAMHWLTGEDQFGATVLQLLGLGVCGVLLYFIAKRLFGTPAAIGTFVVFLGLRTWQLDWVARRLLSENVYFVVLPATLLFLLGYLDQRRTRDLLLAGAFLGLSIVTRGPTLLYVPPVLVLVARALRSEGVARRAVVLALVGLVAVSGAFMALVPLRNLVVANQPAIVASSGGVNLEKLHRPTSKVRMNEAERRWYAPYVQDIPTREVLEFIQQDPVGYAATYVPLALYALGYGAAIDESSVVLWPDLVVLNALYLAAILVSARARSARAGLLHAFIGLHFATMLVFAPYDYDNRLVLPMYVVMAVFGGFSLSGGFIAVWSGLCRATPLRSLSRVAEPPSTVRGHPG
jgi:hypothetical protein